MKVAAVLAAAGLTLAACGGGSEGREAAADSAALGGSSASAVASPAASAVASASAAGEEDASTEQAVTDEEAVTAAAVPCPDPATWMACMFPKGEKAITEITMPGSHDAATYAIQYGQDYANGCGSVPTWIPEAISGKWARTQSGDLGQQAANGSRYFDIRVYFRGDGSLSTCHSLEGATFADAMGKNSAFQKFVRSHPNEIFILDFQQYFAENGSSDSPNRKKQLNAWIQDQLGDILVTRADDTSKISDLTLADMRASGRNVIIINRDSMVTDLSTWPRSKSQYSEWNDVSKPAITFWDTGMMGGQEQWPIDLAERELGVLGRAPSSGTLNILNYITDTNCPDDKLGKASCYSAYVGWAGTISNFRDWVVPRIPSMTRQMAKLNKPAILMRDAVNVDNNAPIWSINMREEG